MIYTREDGGLIGDACRGIYSLAVRIHAAVYFGSLGTRTPMEFDCTCNCEAVGGPLECYCTNPPILLTQEQADRINAIAAAFREQDARDDKQAWLRRMNIKHHGTPTSPVSGKRSVPAPFTGTPYDPDSEED